jgi:hypothetical protein
MKLVATRFHIIVRGIFRTKRKKRSANNREWPEKKAEPANIS